MPRNRTPVAVVTGARSHKREREAPPVPGGLFPEDDDILPGGADRNGRHWLRVELSSTLLKYRTALMWQLWKRRPNGVFAQAT